MGLMFRLTGGSAPLRADGARAWHELLRMLAGTDDLSIGDIIELDPANQNCIIDPGQRTQVTWCFAQKSMLERVADILVGPAPIGNDLVPSSLRGLAAGATATVPWEHALWGRARGLLTITNGE